MINLDWALFLDSYGSVRQTISKTSIQLMKMKKNWISLAESQYP